MILSKSCEYGLRAVVYISVNSNDNKKAGIKEITKSLKIPAPFLAKILQNLVKNKILGSTKGPNGGFYLSKSAGKISIMDVVAAIDGVDAFNKCVMGFKRCSNEHPCPIHFSVKDFRNQMREELETKTLQQIIVEVNEKKVFV